MSSILHPSARAVSFCARFFARLWLHEDGGVHRRRLIASLGTTIALPCVAAAQQKAMPVIGFLAATGSPARDIDADRAANNSAGRPFGRRAASASILTVH
jgi:hypothetical protein